MFKRQTAILIFSWSLIFSLQGCRSECDDSDAPYTLRGINIQIRLIQASSGDYLIQNNDGAEGIYSADDVIFYNDKQALLPDYFYVDDGIIFYTVGLEVNYSNPSFSYFIQFTEDGELIPFTLTYSVTKSECFGDLIWEAGIYFNSDLQPFNPFEINDIYI